MAKWSLDSLPILPGRYEFQVAKGKSKQFKIVKRLLKGTDTVINGCVLLGAKAIFTLDFLNGIVENKKILANIEIQIRSEEHTSELQSRGHLVCRLLLEKK